MPSRDIVEACEEYRLDFGTASSDEVFDAVVHYDGLCGSYPRIIKRWIREIYRIDLDRAYCLKNAIDIARYLMKQGLSCEIKTQLAALLDSLEFLGTIQG